MPPEISEEELVLLKAAAEKSVNLEASKKRLEDENSKIKGRAKEAEELLSTAEKAKLEAEGRTQELLDKERADRMDLEAKYTRRTKDVLNERLRTEVMKHAKNAHDVDMLLKVTQHRDVLKLDEDNLQVDGAKEFVDKVRETHSYLFTKPRIDVGENNPPGTPNEEFKSSEEKYLSELRTCNTRHDIVAVRKKYGKAVD